MCSSDLDTERDGRAHSACAHKSHVQSDSSNLTPGLVLVRSHRIFETRLEGLPTWDEGPTPSITRRVTIPNEPVSLHPNTMTDEEPDQVITPLPRLQTGILLLTLLMEPICSQYIYPFVNKVTPF